MLITVDAVKMPFGEQPSRRHPTFYHVAVTPSAHIVRAPPDTTVWTFNEVGARRSEPSDGKAIAWIKANYAKPLRVEDLAQTAGMGVSTLHHHFRVLTAMSPLQYQKQLRLQAARGRMLMDGIDAASAAFEVGYESASQFNREYSRLFGQPPMRDIRILRSPGAPPLDSVTIRQNAI